MLKRLLFALFLGFVAAGPVAGCRDEKISTFERSETTTESEPQMVSPGNEKLY